MLMRFQTFARMPHRHFKNPTIDRLNYPQKRNGTRLRPWFTLQQPNMAMKNPRFIDVPLKTANPPLCSCIGAAIKLKTKTRAEVHPRSRNLWHQLGFNLVPCTPIAPCLGVQFSGHEWIYFTLFHASFCRNSAKPTDGADRRSHWHHPNIPQLHQVEIEL